MVRCKLKQIVKQETTDVRISRFTSAISRLRLSSRNGKKLHTQPGSFATKDVAHGL